MTMSEKKFGAAEAVEWVLENMSKDPKRTRRILLYVAFGILGSGFLYTSGGRITELIFGSKTGQISYAPQSMTGSHNGLQIQGNNNSVNQEANFSWDNENSWQKTINNPPSCSNSSECKFSVRLFFYANGPVIPVRNCLHVSSDARILSATLAPWGADHAVVDYLAKNVGNDVNVCSKGDIGTSPIFDLEFQTRPTRLQANVVRYQ